MSPDRDDETPRNRAGRTISDDSASDDAITGSRTNAAADDGTESSESSGVEPEATPEVASSSASDADSGATSESDPGDSSEPIHDARADEEFGPVEETGPRDIVVPTRLFKLVTVATTLLAVPAVVIGFMFLDAATLQTSVARRTVLFVVSWLGLPIDEALVSILLGLVGIGLIAAGAGIYIVGSRFRAAGMGNAEEDTDEDSTNG